MNRLLLPLGLLVFLFVALPVAQADPPVLIPLGDTTCNVKITWGPPPALKPEAETAPVAEEKKVKPPITSMVSAVILRKGKLRQDTYTYASNTTGEAWTMLDTGLTLLEKTSGTGVGKGMYEIPRGSVLRYALIPTILDLDIPSITWINPGTLTGKVVYGSTKRPALHYACSQSIPQIQGPPHSVVYQAWIDPKTFAPIAFYDGDSLYEFTFSDPPEHPLALPDHFRKDLQHYLNANTTLQHL